LTSGRGPAPGGTWEVATSPLCRTSGDGRQRPVPVRRSRARAVAGRCIGAAVGRVAPGCRHGWSQAAGPGPHGRVAQRHFRAVGHDACVRIEMSNEVADAISAGRAVVALESTLLAHGFPPGDNLAIAAQLERTVREEGAVPATIAVLDGKPTVGLTADQIHTLCTSDDVAKLSLRDLGPAIGLGRTGATTVAGTAALAHAAGIGVFATGGLGGVHLPAGDDPVSWDVSADIGVLAATGVLVVSSGVKSVLDIPATLEALETRSVPVVGYRSDDFPAFYLRSSGH